MALLDIKNKIYAGIIGHAIGDALGVPVEFSDRIMLQHFPVSDMVGFGTHNQPAGTWSDDTSMEIALMQSIIDCKSINYDDIMKKFTDWLFHDKFTATDVTFDVGGTCSRAIRKYDSTKNWQTCGCDDDRSNGNGSLMRILPVAFICYSYKLHGDERYRLVRDISSLTHAHEISVLGCYIYVNFICNLLDDEDKFTAYKHTQEADYSMFSTSALDAYRRILKENISERSEDEIRSSGYVVSSLEAALWSLLTSDDYASATLKAVNLGSDTDTVGAITGSMAGIVYPESIPQKWIDKLQRASYLSQLIEEFATTEISL
jgi:ADP-ribosylglycohydrolase